VPTKTEAGLASRHCDTCGETEEKELSYLELSAMSLSVNDGLCVQFKVDLETVDGSGYETPYVIVVLDGKETRLENQSTSGEYYVYELSGVSYKDIYDTMEVTVYGMLDGNAVRTVTEEYTVLQYLDELLETSADTEAVKFAEEIKEYNARIERNEMENRTAFLNANNLDLKFKSILKNRYSGIVLPDILVSE